MRSAAIIECKKLIPHDLQFDYPGNALDFTISTGEVISIIGPDYSGKGNWLRAICGLENQLSGNVIINGHDTQNISATDWITSRMKVAYLHEDTALLSATNGLMNVLIPALYHQLDKKQQSSVLAEKALDLLEQIDPDIELDDLPAYISKDHQFKIAVARALLLKPDVLALNNPFAHFNNRSKHQFQKFLNQQVNNGLSIILITHDIHYALSISDKIIFANRENIIHFDSVSSMVNCDIPMVNEFLNLPENQAIT